MKKLILIGALALGGCSGLPQPPVTPGLLSPLVSSGVITEATRTKARQVQAAVANICQYVPTVASVVAIINASAGLSAGAIGQGICNAVTTAPLADGGGRIAFYNGVRIYGRFK